jgi:SAM-dependent methyltransferase
VEEQGAECRYDGFVITLLSCSVSSLGTTCFFCRATLLQVGFAKAKHIRSAPLCPTRNKDRILVHAKIPRLTLISHCARSYLSISRAWRSMARWTIGMIATKRRRTCECRVCVCIKMVTRHGTNVRHTFSHCIYACGGITHRGPCDWYRNYFQLRHLINPASLAGAALNQKQQQAQHSLDEKSGGGANHSPRDGTTTSVSVATSFPERHACRVLILGCGNSTIGIDMLRDGWTGGILNVDFSPSVIHQLQQAYPAVPQNGQGVGRLDFVCADITLPLDFLPSASFDLILCKGALDAVLCQSRTGALSMIRECARLLAPGHGILVLVTSGNPDCRLEYLEHENSLSFYWRGVSVHTLKDETKMGNPSAHGGNNQLRRVL